ncbi:hypothetical protein CPA50_06170 [Marinobacter sp. ANT_B65]|nr:hypothetical protein CPA50_06170 [Marinobacter sp. ANT_B65]
MHVSDWQWRAALDGIGDEGRRGLPLPCVLVANTSNNNDDKQKDDKRRKDFRVHGPISTAIKVTIQ